MCPSAVEFHCGRTRTAAGPAAAPRRSADAFAFRFAVLPERDGFSRAGKYRAYTVLFSWCGVVNALGNVRRSPSFALRASAFARCATADKSEGKPQLDFSV